MTNLAQNNAANNPGAMEFVFLRWAALEATMAHPGAT